MPDTTFAGDGSFTEPFGPNGDEPFAMAVQPDGKVVVAGWINTDPPGIHPMDAAVLRLNPDGTRDASFGDGGLVRWEIDRNARPEAMVLQPDGKILISGLLSPDSPSGLLRLLPDGRPDPSFGQGGLVAMGVAGGSGLALEPDGRIVVAGRDPSPEIGVTLVRFTAAGDLDTTFGTNGSTRVPVVPGQPDSDSPTALARLDDGSFMVVGAHAGATTSDTLTMRFRPDGQLDPQFNGTGIKVFDFGGFDTGIGVLSDSGGRAVIGSKVSNDGPQVMARLLPTGELDPSFGDGGLVHPGPTMTVIGRAPDGDIVVGTAGAYAELSRYRPDGRLDPSLDGRSYRTPMPQGSYT
ncbi:MAG: delta-60 repeat domain-containing protein, partial [Acidimicrobiia bacterium]